MLFRSADGGVGQCFTSGEGTTTQCGDTVGNTDALQLRAVVKGTVADNGAALVDDHRRNVGTTFEHASVHGLQTAAEFNLRQRRTTVKRITTIFANTAGPVDVAQTGTAVEGMIADDFHLVAQLHRFKAGAVLESIVVDGLDTIANGGGE